MFFFALSVNYALLMDFIYSQVVGNNQYIEI